MRSLISAEAPASLGIASPIRRAVPAVYQEDPLFALLCEAFDDLLAPLVTAVDCFDAYLDPHLAPSDFLPWLAGLVGYQGTVEDGTRAERGHIASAVRDHTRRGTALGVREAVAREAAVPVEQVELDDPGGTRWSAVPGGASGGWPQRTAARIRVRVPPPAEADQDIDEFVRRTAAAVRAAIDAAAGVHCGIAVEITTQAAPPRRTQPRGARTYGGS